MAITIYKVTDFVLCPKCDGTGDSFVVRGFPARTVILDYCPLCKGKKQVRLAEFIIRDPDYDKRNSVTETE